MSYIKAIGYNTTDLDNCFTAIYHVLYIERTNLKETSKNRKILIKQIEQVQWKKWITCLVQNYIAVYKFAINIYNKGWFQCIWMQQMLAYMMYAR